MSAPAKGTVDELQRIREERAVLQRELDGYHDQAVQLEIRLGR